MGKSNRAMHQAMPRWKSTASQSGIWYVHNRCNSFGFIAIIFANCDELTLESCDIVSNEAVNLTTSTEWRKLKSLTELHFRPSTSFPTNQILASMAVNGAPLKHLSFGMYELKLTDDFLHEYVAPLKQLETVMILNKGVPDIDIYRLTRDLTKLTEIILVQNGGVKADEVKSFIRRINQHFDISIRLQYSFLDNLSDEDLDEINDLIRARPGMQFKLVIASRCRSIVSILAVLVIRIAASV